MKQRNSMDGVDIPFIMYCIAVCFAIYFGVAGYILGWWL